MSGAAEAQQFVFEEARLLDERRFSEWLALYAPDAEYWVPYAWGQEDPRTHVSLIYETVALLRMRVERLESGEAPLQWPPSRTHHHISNVTCEAGQGELRVRGYLLYIEYRRGEQRWFSGRCTWRLAPKGDSFLIRAKRVDLLNADQDSGHLRIAVPF